MNGIKDGGPAFPVPDQQHSGGLDGYYGMTLRDYFIAHSPQAGLVWVYRERPAPGAAPAGEFRWYLQGLYA